ncbi:MAG: TrmH family RNA methyltransferase [Mycobacteriales bacterium]
MTTARSPRVRAARRLTKRAFRQQDGRFLVEGPQAVREAVAAPGTVVELFATSDAATRHAELLAAARSGGAAVHLVTDPVMGELAETVTPQGLVAVATFAVTALADVVGSSPRLVAVLAFARDPGNAGTVVRVADGASADAVVFPDGAVDPYNPKCVRSAAGSHFHLPVVTGVDVAEAVSALRAGGLRVLAATAAVEAVPIDDVDLRGPTAWLFGNEAWGLPAEVAGIVDTAVRVPIYGRAESLNLATAAAVCLYASARAQRAPGGCREEGP